MSDPDNYKTESYQFLLGLFDDEERTAFEVRYLANDKLREEVEVAEEHLIHDYARGELPGSIRALFEARLEDSPLWRQEVDEASALYRAAIASVPPGKAAASMLPRIALLVAAAAIICGVVWFFLPRAEGPRPDSTDSTAVLALAATVRQVDAPGTPPSVMIDDSVSTLRLLLAIPQSLDFPSFDATVRALDSDARFERRALEPRRAEAGRELVVDLDAAPLTAGEFTVELFGLRDGRPTPIAVASYGFGVLRP